MCIYNGSTYSETILKCLLTSSVPFSLVLYFSWLHGRPGHLLQLCTYVLAFILRNGEVIRKESTVNGTGSTFLFNFQRFWWTRIITFFIFQKYFISLTVLVNNSDTLLLDLYFVFTIKLVQVNFSIFFDYTSMFIFHTQLTKFNTYLIYKWS